MSSASTTPSRVRASSSSSTPKPNVVLVSPSPSSHSHAPSPSPRKPTAGTKPLINHKPTTTRRSLALTKPKSGPLGDDPSAARSHLKVKDSINNGNGNGIRSTNRPAAVEQHTRPSPRQPPPRLNHTAVPADSSEALIVSLQSEVLTLKAELKKAQSFNLELQSQNESLSQQLASAVAHISSLTTTPWQSESGAEYQNPKFKDIQRLISNKLECPAVSNEEKVQTCFTSNQCSSIAPSPPPPPPPPLPCRPAAKSVASQKVSSVVELYQSLSNMRGNSYAPVRDHSKNTSSAHNSIVGEIQNRSTHLLAIKMDIETKGEFINGLIQKVLAAAYTDIEDVLSFVDWLDKELSLLADEQAVLKHFKWPEKKADAMREAAIEYRNLKLLENEVSSYKDDLDVPYGISLKKMVRLLDKSERSLLRLIQLQSSAMLSYRGHKIPTDWMLDSGIASKIKQASINLAKIYVKRVIVELESIRYSERESTQEALLLQGVHFAYRAHQLSGGLDSETLCAFEEIRRRVPVQLQGSPQLFSGITSSQINDRQLDLPVCSLLHL